ncbi:MAG: sec-independent protein translocase protein TatA [Microbacteriaceae bacterium]|jgi:sec-independent protein translocase protein TatA|nr:sec-independent protein translocase protein TatA [Microbacteriaceae bacterium]
MGIFGNGLTGWHLLIILAVVLLLFGAPKLPGLAKSVGQSMRIFKNEMKTMKDENPKPAEGEAPAAAATATPEHPASTESQPKP